MLAYALAIAVGLSSSILFLTAFLMPDVHRRDDFFWSAIGLIYALVLWFCALRITGAVLLGQSAAVALLISYQWQTLKLRKAIAFPEKAAELDNFSVLGAINNLFSRRSVKTQIQPTIDQPKVTEEKIEIPETTTEAVAEVTPSSSEATPSVEEVIDEAIAIEKQSVPKAKIEPTATVLEDKPSSQPVIPDLPEEKMTETNIVSETTETTQTPEPKRTGFLGRLFGKKKKSTPEPAIENQISDILEDEPDVFSEEEPNNTATTLTEPESTVNRSTETIEITQTTTKENTSVTDTEPVEETTVESVKATYTPNENTDPEPAATVEVAAEETAEVDTETTATEATKPSIENISSSKIDSQTKSIDPVEPSEIATETDLALEDELKVEETDTTNIETVENSAPQTDEITEDKNKPDSLNPDDTESSQK